MERFNGAVSSLEDDSSLRGLGRGPSTPADAPDGRGEKLPGALGGGLDCCIVLACFERLAVTSCDSACALRSASQAMSLPHRGDDGSRSVGALTKPYVIFSRVNRKRLKTGM